MRRDCYTSVLAGLILTALVMPARGEQVLYYSFDNVTANTVADLSGFGNDGTLQGGPTVVNGQSGQALAFANSRVAIAPSDSLTADFFQGSFTLSLWINPPRTGNTWQQVFRAVTTSNSSSDTLFLNNNGTLSWRGRVNGVWDAGSAVGLCETAAGAIPANEWTHVAVVGDGTNFRIYLNGALSKESAFQKTDGANATYYIGGTSGTESYSGKVDELHLYNQALAETRIKKLAARPRAEKPDPADGSMVAATWAAMTWRAGDYAVSHDLYMSDSFSDVNDHAPAAYQGNFPTPLVTAGFPGSPFPNGLVPGTTYYWRVDEINNADPNSPWIGPVWSFWIPPRQAYAPNPSDGLKYVDTNVTLGWSAGLDAKLHYIHFGESFDDVNNATGGTPVASRTFTPGALALGKTYYWRVDEVNPPNPMVKGNVWSFTTVPEIPITDPNLMAWWTLDEGMGLTVLDWSGHGRRGTLANGAKWAEGIFGSAVQFDGINDHVNLGTPAELYIPDIYTYTAWFKVGKDIDGNSGPQYLLCIGSRSDLVFGVEDGVGVDGDLSLHYYDTAPGFHAVGVGQTVWSADDWHMVAATKDATGHKIYLDGELRNSDTNTNNDNYNKTRMISLGARAWTGHQYYNGAIDDVRIYDKALTQDQIRQVMRGDPLLAWNPNPTNNSLSDVVRAASVSWSPGDLASQHAVYFGTDRSAVAGADASDTTGIFRGLQAVTSYTPPEGVQFGGGPYYWRIDEHNTDGSVTRGIIWRFSTADYILVDDFESYNDIPTGKANSKLVYETWADGFGTTANGSTMGYTIPFEPTMESDTVHSGSQSAPMGYNNTTAAFSEVTRTLTAQDWTANGIQTLSLWFYGDATNAAGQLYIKINGVKIQYDGDAARLKIAAWQVWNIDLASVGTNLRSVTSLTIGIDGSGATGTLLLDDIRLYPYPREVITPVQPDPAGLVAHYALDGNANDSAGGHNGTAYGNPMYLLGKIGQGISLDGVDDYVVGGSVGISGAAPRTIAGWAKTSIFGTPAWVDVFGFTGPSGTDGHFDIELVGDTADTTLGWYGLHVYSWERDILPIDMEWHHLAASYDGTTIKWYGDGVLIGSDSTRVLKTPDNVHIGKRQDNTNFFPGMVDDVRFYSRVLSDGEVAGLAGMTKPFDKAF